MALHRYQGSSHACPCHRRWNLPAASSSFPCLLFPLPPLSPASSFPCLLLPLPAPSPACSSFPCLLLLLLLPSMLTQPEPPRHLPPAQSIADHLIERRPQQVGLSSYQGVEGRLCPLTSRPPNYLAVVDVGLSCLRVRLVGVALGGQEEVVALRLGVGMVRMVRSWHDRQVVEEALRGSILLIILGSRAKFSLYSCLQWPDASQR